MEVEVLSSKLRKIVSKVIVRKIPASQSVDMGKRKFWGQISLQNLAYLFLLWIFTWHNNIVKALKSLAKKEK